MDSAASQDAYMARVNRAVDVVLQDLSGDLRLERLATEAGFSPFHFHRVFKATTGETLAEFVGRVRLERALRLMAHGDTSLTEIAARCGFGSSSSFRVERFAIAMGFRQLAARTLLYRRVTNPYQPGRIATAIDELTELIEAEGIESESWFGYSWDDPEIVDAVNCRYDIAVDVPAERRVGSTLRSDRL